jgi:hypothetical protein
MGLKQLLSRVGKGLVRRFGSELEQVALDRIDKADAVAHTLIDRGADAVKRKVKKRIAQSK